MGKKRRSHTVKKPNRSQKNELSLERLRTEADFLKYIRLLKEFSKKYCVMIVVCDTPVGPATTREMTGALMDIGLRADLYGKYRCAYAALIDAGQVVFEELSADTVKTKIMVGKGEIELVSAGFHTGDRRGQIRIDGQEYSPRERSLTQLISILMQRMFLAFSTTRIR